MTPTIDRHDLVTRLLALPLLILEAEREVCIAQNVLHACREDLADAEARLILSEMVTGKNAEQRAAQVRQATALHRQAIQEAQEEAQVAAYRLRALQAEHSGLRAAARLLAGDNHD